MKERIEKLLIVETIYENAKDEEKIYYEPLKDREKIVDQIISLFKEIIPEKKKEVIESGNEMHILFNNIEYNQAIDDINNKIQ